MILPIVAYGDPVLRKVAVDIGTDYPQLDELLTNMWDTMYNANGIGLAAPQIGLAIRVFVIDSAPFADDEDLSEEEQDILRNFKSVFINAKIESETGKEWAFNEGCLSIPDVREDVLRKDTLVISYLNEAFEPQTRTFDGLLARVIQHEYDHIEGVLFTDKLSALKKRLLQGRLTNIAKGNVKVDYKMRYPQQKKAR